MELSTEKQSDDDSNHQVQSRFPPTQRPMSVEICSEDIAIVNSIGLLQEMCMFRHWPPPIYEVANEEGLPHEKQFTITCVVFKHREIGIGKRKKVAKKQAALKMWLYLQELIRKGCTSPQGLDDDDENTCLNNKEFNFVEHLQEISEVHQFEVTYMDIEEKSFDGKCQCLVQLSTFPVTVCHGFGDTSKDAYSNAAQNALECLIIMTKKSSESVEQM